MRQAMDCAYGWNLSAIGNSMMRSPPGGMIRSDGACEPGAFFASQAGRSDHFYRGSEVSPGDDEVQGAKG